MHSQKNKLRESFPSKKGIKNKIITQTFLFKNAFPLIWNLKRQTTKLNPLKNKNSCVFMKTENLVLCFLIPKLTSLKRSKF